MNQASSTPIPIPDDWFGRAQLAVARAASGKPGDFALLKADLFGAGATPEIEKKLENVRGYQPEIDLDQLARLPKDTFGKKYADWMLNQDLHAFVISADLDPMAVRNTLAMRYAVTHDMFHVLTGFDTSYAGEIGVLSFAAAQNYSSQFSTGLKIASIIYPILSGGDFKSIAAAKNRGGALGHQAIFLLGERLEEHFSENLDALRSRLRLPMQYEIDQQAWPHK